MSNSIEALEGVNVNDRSAVVFLVNPKSRFINAKGVFDEYDKDGQRPLKHSATLFVDGHSHRRRHHGWDQSQRGGKYTRCYVLKAPPDIRYYGFLTNPAVSNPRLQVCVLVHFDTKNQPETDFSILDKILRLIESKSVTNSLIEFFKPKGKKK